MITDTTYLLLLPNLLIFIVKWTHLLEKLKIRIPTNWKMSLAKKSSKQENLLYWKGNTLKRPERDTKKIFTRNKLFKARLSKVKVSYQNPLR